MTHGVVHQIEHRLSVREESDLVVVRRLIRELGRRQGLADASIEALATAATELARNIVVHAGSGEILIGFAYDAHRRGIVVVSRDDGPGIADLVEAMKDGFSTQGTLGLGLSSARRLADDFEIASMPGNGTVITLRKWSSEEPA